MRFVWSFLLSLCLHDPIYSQETEAKRNSLQQQLGLELGVPIDVFRKTHRTGASLVYTISTKLGAPTINRLRNLGWITSAGLQYFPGKTETGSSYSFQYDDYYRLNLALGVNGRPFSLFSYSLLAGVSTSSYSNNIRVGWNLQAQTLFLISEKISVGPGFLISDMSETAALLNLNLRVMYSF